MAAWWLILVLLAAANIPCFAAEQTYVVKKGDTLWGIAQKFGTTSSKLAERNGLGRNGHIYAGQRLRIPGTDAKAPAATTARTPLQTTIDKAPVKSGRWKYIVIHHSGVDTGTLKGMDQYHREKRRMENGLAYHFVIGNGSGMGDGEIAAGHRWTKQLPGGHLASEAQNQVSIGICLVGNFDKRPPTAKQIRSLRLLVQSLMKRCNLSAKAVRTHQQINVIGTRCPGSKFPTRSFLNSIDSK